LAGCTSAQRYREMPANGPRPHLLNAPFPSQPPSAVLVTVIVPRGPGSWKARALWDEYVVLLRNAESAPVTITAAELVDATGVAHAPGLDPWTLESRSATLRQAYDRAGIAFAEETAGAALYLGGIAAGSSAAAAAASTAGVTVTVLPGPLALVSVPAYVVGRTLVNREGRANIEADFRTRRLPLPLDLAPGRIRVGSLFFPMIPRPTVLRLCWRSGATAGVSELPLPFLSNLHVPSASRASPTRP
jgi:hypothetical protein